ncbi:DNA polymerase III subunit gamma/tau [Chloroflexota bacterium]
MSSQVFYRKWRPQILADVVGQEQVTQTLINALTSERVSHAYLFCGPRGTGKTSTGRILAKAVNCLTNNGKGEPCNTCSMCQATTEGRALDVIEVDAASNRGIDEIRDLREKSIYAPNQARFKVYIIDEVHMLTKEASNALLKTLEEPPPHIIFILATTEAHKVLPTILSRCQRFDFRRIPQADVVSKLSSICSTEGIHIGPEALRLIAKATTGSLRDAENLLQQLSTYYGADIELQQVQTVLGITGDWRARDLVRHIINNDIPAGVATINSANNDGLDLRQFNRELVEYLRTLLLIRTGADESIDLTAEDVNELKELAAKASFPQILKAVKLFGQLELGFDNYSTLPLELALIDCILPPVEEREESPVKEMEVPTSQVEPKKPSKIPSPPVVPPPQEQPIVKAEPPGTPEPVTSVEESPPTTLPEPGSEVERLRLNWKQIIQESPGGAGRTRAAALLRSAKPLAIEDDVIVLSFKYPLLKENMEKIDNQKAAENIVSHFLKRPCRVRCVYEPENDHLVRATLKIGAQIIDAEEK